MTACHAFGRGEACRNGYAAYLASADGRAHTTGKARRTGERARAAGRAGQTGGRTRAAGTARAVARAVWMKWASKWAHDVLVAATGDECGRSVDRACAGGKGGR